MGAATVIVLVTPPGADPEATRAHREFHLAAGADEVVAGGAGVQGSWLLEASGEEFWWPVGGSLREVLDALPERYGGVDALVRRLVAVAGAGPLHERATHRVVGHAGRRRARKVGGPDRVPRGWYPLEVLALDASPPLGPDEVERRERDGTLVPDTRLRDALRALAAGEELSFPRRSAVEDARLAADVAALGDADVVAAQRRLDGLEERLAALESLTPLRLERRLRDLVRRRG